jgi:ADP-dependent NAD(P)H-hydrate dehydratase / NAD(P)H-hydrate epimerase
MITAIETKVLDTNSEYYGVSTTTLMENAGKVLAKFIEKKCEGKKNKILIFCGPGNNGGDGFVAARYLSDTVTTSIFLPNQEIKTSDAKKNFELLQKYNIDCYSKIEDIDLLIDNHNILVDAMLGIGIKGELREPYKTVVEKINSAKNKTKISVDIPTGFNTKLSVQPQYTVTFHDIKYAMNTQNCGDITIADIGIPSNAITHVGPGELIHLYPKPHKQSHKGQNGTVLVIGGGPYTGAPALAGLAALRTGADLVYIATPKRCWDIVASFSANFIVKSLSSDFLNLEDISVIEDILPYCDSVVIGPGLGRKPQTIKAIREIIPIIKKTKKPMVIDADAIHAIAQQLEIIKHSSIVFTPHQAEFKALTGASLSDSLKDRCNTVKLWAQTMNNSIFLKGYVDILTNGVDIKLNTIHNQAMTVGGTGDVLSGIIASLLSKGIDSFDAMRIAAFINGEAGNIVYDQKSYGLLATDIIETIPFVLQKYL